MVFSSLFFLYIFLPVTLLLYYIAPSIRSKNFILTVLSLFFYAWGEPLWVVLLLLSSLIDFVCGQIIGKNRRTWKAKAALTASITLNLILLGSFKYGNFFIENINALTGLAIPFTGLTLPIGISFYTFQTMSYTIDVYRDEVYVQKSFMDFLLFVSLFPQLIAGPILRYSELEFQLRQRKSSLKLFSEGITRFLSGLAKKVLIANYASAVVTDLLDSSKLASLTVTQAWLGIVLYAFHIYFDFSGYSDMAIGLGKMFGFQYSENFNYPYIARSITDFWRRWHMSLSSFFRDYVYIPLGGNRFHPFRNLFLVWALTGLWHGASWNFILWGIYFFVLLALEKYLLKGLLKKIPAAVSLFGTFFFVLMGWVLFYFTDLNSGLQFYRLLFGGTGNPLINPESELLLVNNLPLLLICIIGSTPLVANMGRKLFEGQTRASLPSMISAFSIPVYNTAILLLCTVSLVGATHNPFIYFRF